MVERGGRWMVYGQHGSRGREWWGTIVVGGPGGDACGGWRGWLRVDREGRPGFGGVASADEALLERGEGEGERPTWVVSSEWGGFSFREEELARGGLEGGGEDGGEGDDVKGAALSIGGGMED